MNLKLGVFTTSSLDNLDIEIKSTFSKTSLHGTAASLNQHPNETNSGDSREKIELRGDKAKLKSLPDWYLEISPFHLKDDVAMPKHKDLIPEVTVDERILNEDEQWLQDELMSSWAVHHARKCQAVEFKTESAMLPIWRDDSKSPATIKHVIDVLITATLFLNPGQTPVIGMDQPLYAIAKRIQWDNPTSYGQNKQPIDAWSSSHRNGYAKLLGRLAGR